MSEQNGATSPTSGKKPARTIDRGARESQTLQTLQQNNTNNLRTMFESIGSQRDRNRGGTLPRNFGAKQFDQEEKSAYASQKEPVSRTTSATTSNATSSTTTSSSNSANWKTASGPTPINNGTTNHTQEKAAWKSSTPSAAPAQSSSQSKPTTSTAHSSKTVKTRPTGFVWSSATKTTAPRAEEEIEDESAPRTRPQKAKPKPNPERQTVRLEAQQIQQYIQQQLQLKQQQGKQPTNAQQSSQPNNQRTNTTTSTTTQSNVTTPKPAQTTNQPSTQNPPAAQVKEPEAAKPVAQTQTTQTPSPASPPQERPSPSTTQPSPSTNQPSQSTSQPSKSQVSQSTTNASNADLFLVINDKWRINYEDLEFDELVSAGSAGEVYLGYFFGTPVAIKKLYAVPQDQKHLVAREFSLLTDVNHPNIVQFLGICDHTSGIYLITEYVEHGDLFDLLVFGSEDIGWKNKVKIALQIAQGVYYLHSKNIIHRDLKSQNVLIGEANKVKLCDLGLATIMESRQKRMTICGTNEWMAPEIGIADQYDSKVDVFSFGIVLVELISNKPPSKRTIQEKFAFNVKAFQALVPSTCPPEFAQLVIDCTVYDAAKRPSFKEIVPRLRTLLGSLDD